jgi:hypothetical protein
VWRDGAQLKAIRTQHCGAAVVTRWVFAWLRQVNTYRGSITVPGMVFLHHPGKIPPLLSERTGVYEWDILGHERKCEIRAVRGGLK